MKMAPVAQPGRALAWYKGFLESQGSRVQSPPGANYLDLKSTYLSIFRRRFLS